MLKKITELEIFSGQWASHKISWISEQFMYFQIDANWFMNNQ